MQFTGIHDRNGKKIYAGDIFGGIYEKTYVKWDDKLNGFQFFWVFDNTSTEGEFYWFEAESKDLEVIGNIYENPELMKIE